MTTSFLRSLTVAVVCICFAAIAGAQTAPAQQSPEASQSSDESIRPSTTTFAGDTGLWFVPTADVLARHTWSLSAYRAGFNYPEGFTNVGVFDATVSVGLFTGMEVFGSLHLDRRIDRDVRPLFTSNPDVGGAVLGYPLVNQGWTGDNVGDLYIGMKSGILSQARGRPFSLAMREFFKIPIADEDKGIGTGKIDTAIQGVVSSDINKTVELSGYGGVLLRGKSPNITLPNSFTWGVGAGFPSHGALRLTTEVNGDLPFKDTATLGTALTGTDGSRAPTTQTAHGFTAATVGLNWQARSGFFVGGGLSWNFPTKDRAGLSLSETDVTGDFVDYQIRLGFHPGVKQFVAPKPPPPPPPPPQNRAPTVKAQCDPCTVEVGKSSTVTADGRDPDGDTLVYRWSAPAGSFRSQSERQTLWTAPQQDGPVQASVTVDDGKGSTASDSVTIQVVRPKPVLELSFEDVYFDFDRSTLRPEALRLLDDAITRLQANPDKSIVIEGHTCSIGTAEYNLALGDRRANSVREYLVSRGVPAGRMESRSYGEERPKHDNAREETRRLNRRAALVVKIQ
jgi:outer membrane protein OmpA-like peptidoglycan-associated protein